MKTNERFDRLTNLDISTHYRDTEFWLMRGDFLSAFAYWVINQSPYKTPDISSPLSAFDGYLAFIFPDDLPKKFTYDEVKKVINEEAFEAIPAIEELNHPKKEGGIKQSDPDTDFIDLGALARNVFYMILREYITQSLESK